MKNTVLVLTVVGLTALATSHANAETARVAPKAGTSRNIAVRDAIQMTTLGERLYLRGEPSRGLVAHFSPDSQKFIVILRRGDLEKNTTEYSLVMWNTVDLFKASTPTVLLKMNSSSNRPAIERLSWLGDNNTLAFLGENPGELHQLHTYNIQTHVLKTLTHHPTNLEAYSLASGVDALAYAAEPPDCQSCDDMIARYGMHVSIQDIYSLLAGKLGGPSPSNDQIFFQHGTRRPRQLSTIGNPLVFFDSLALSPNGHSLVLLTWAPSIPSIWQQYSDPRFQLLTKQHITPGTYSSLAQYEQIETTTGQAKLLLDSPLRWRATEPKVAWSPSGEAVVLTDMYLPLAGVEGGELKTRQSSDFVVEVKINTGAIAKVVQGDDLILRGWEPDGNSLDFEVRKPSKDGSQDQVIFHKKDNSWMRANTNKRLPTIVLDEDMSTPPKIYAIDPTSSRRILLLDLNPGFNSLQFGKVEEIGWQSDDRELKGALYYPPDFARGRKYPLVIQTHGWEPDRFRMDGPYPTAFAARPLAGAGVMVLQIPDDDKDVEGTPVEGVHQLASFRGAIEYLDSRGLIDKSRIGLVGFSRTCLAVKYALTRPDFDVTAASVTDGFDGGYLQYILAANAHPGFIQESEGINGGPPWGKTAQLWQERPPSSHLDRVNTPLLITALYRDSLLAEWEWFSGLSRLGKPVDMIYIPNGVHLLEKPWERMVSQQSTVDWFLFWLKGEEDTAPEKMEQYKRWRELRGIRKQNAIARKGVADSTR